MAQETVVDNLIINTLTLSQFEAIENPSETQLYLVKEPDEVKYNDEEVVHKEGTEVIVGDKTFTGSVVLNNGTALTQPITDNSNAIATTKYVNDLIESLIQRIEVLENQLGA